MSYIQEHKKLIVSKYLVSRQKTAYPNKYKQECHVCSVILNVHCIYIHSLQVHWLKLDFTCSLFLVKVHMFIGYSYSLHVHWL